MCSPRKILRKRGTNPYENSIAEAHSQHSRFATLLKSNPRTDTPPQIRSTSAELPPPTSYSSSFLLVLLQHVKRALKDLNSKTFSFKVVERILLTLKMSK